MTKNKSSLSQYYKNVASPNNISQKNRKEILVNQNATQYLKYSTDKPMSNVSNISFHHKTNSKLINHNYSRNENINNAPYLKVNLSRDGIVSMDNYNNSKHKRDNSMTYSNSNVTTTNNNNDFYTQKVSKLQKENNILILKNNQQKTVISNLTKEKEKLENDLKSALESKNNLQIKYDKLKENQDQLIMLLKLVEKEGVNLENIINKWNSQMDDGEGKNEQESNHAETEMIHVNEENNEEEKGGLKEDEKNNQEGEENNEEGEEKEDEDDNNNDLQSDEEFGKEGEFLPLTLEDNNNINNNAKIYKANVPKLDFGGIKILAERKKVNEKPVAKKGFVGYHKVIKKK